MIINDYGRNGNTICQMNINGGRIEINGREYCLHGKSLEMRDGHIFVDGTPIEEYDESNIPVLKIEVTGNVESLRTESGDVTVNGSCGFVKTMSGDVTCDDISDGVQTMSGDVRCGNIHGGCSTMSGDIYRQ